MPSQNQVGAILSNAYGNASRSIREGGRAQGQGFASLGSSLGQGIQQGSFLREDRKKKESAATGIRNMLDNNPDLAKRLGYDPENADSYSTNDILGMGKALELQSQAGAVALQELARRQEERKLAETAKANALADRFLRQADGEGRGGLSSEAQELAKRFAESSAGRARRLGLNLTPELLSRFAQGEGLAFRPEVFDLGGGVRAMSTSPSSAVPLREDEAAPAPREGGPELSKDGRFYLDGNQWKPLRSSGGDLDPTVRAMYLRQRTELQQKLADLSAKRQNTPKDPFGPNFLRTTQADVDEEIRQTQLRLGELNTILSGGSGGGLPPPAAETAPPPGGGGESAGYDFDGLLF